jgi:hypothetical protein
MLGYILDKLAKFQYNRFNSWLRRNKVDGEYAVTVGEVYNKMHKMFPEGSPITRIARYKYFSGDNNFLYEH